MLIFNYSKNYNNFFFISNLAEWHFSCREKYNEIWLRNNPLNKEEAEALVKIGLIFRKYGFGENYLGLAFFGKKISWNKLKKRPSRQEIKIIRKTFWLFNRRFNEVWKKGLKGLQFWKKELRKEMNQADNQRNLAIFKKFLNSRHPKIIKVHLLISPPKGGLGGQAITSKNIVTLDCSGAFRRDKKIVVSLLMHEIIHIFQRDFFEPLVENFIKKKQIMNIYPRRWPELYGQKWGPKSLFKETIAYCLTKTRFGRRKENFPKIEVRRRPKTVKEALGDSIKKNQDLIDSYFISRKPVDENLLEAIWNNFAER